MIFTVIVLLVFILGVILAYYAYRANNCHSDKLPEFLYLYEKKTGNYKDMLKQSNELERFVRKLPNEI